MPIAKANGLEIAYETFGPPQGRPLILIMGLVNQMVNWPEAFCRQLAAAGHRVVRFDNRDTGLSTKMEAMGVPDLNQLFAALQRGEPLQVPYTLGDMAADTFGLLDYLGLSSAHICGMSMGGMIGQLMALAKPQRVTSLISMMSTTGEPDLPPSTPAALEAMLSVPPQEREAYSVYLANICKAFGDGSPLYDEQLQRDLAGLSFDRGLYPWTFARQMAAMAAGAGRRRALNALGVPTLVLHGTHDTVLPPEHGRDTARAIPGARLVMIDGLGHGLAYPALWPQICEAITRHTAASD